MQNRWPPYICISSGYLRLMGPHGVGGRVTTTSEPALDGPATLAHVRTDVMRTLSVYYRNVGEIGIDKC